MSGVVGAVLGWIGVLAVAGGALVTWGEGLLLLVAGALALARPRGWPVLIAAAAGALLLGASLRTAEPLGVLCAAGVGAHLLSLPRGHGEVSGVEVPWALPLVVGIAAALMMIFPTWLPLQYLVRARPFGASLAVGGALLVSAAAFGALVRQPTPRRWGAILLVTGVVSLANTGFLLASPADDADVAALLDTASRARRVGLRRVETSRVLQAMRVASNQGDARETRRIFEQHTRGVDLTRRNAEVLRLYAQSLDQTGAPATDVDAVLRKALRLASREQLAAFQQWPGETRLAPVAQRARVRASALGVDVPEPITRAGTRDCFGGSWCLVRAELPAIAPSEDPAVARLVFRKVAPAVSDVRVQLEITWRDWIASGLLPADAGAVGEEVVVEVPVDMRRPRPGDHEVWMSLHPRDGGAPLGMETLPGWRLAVGHMVYQP